MKRLVFIRAFKALCVIFVLFFVISGCEKNYEKHKDESKNLRGKWLLTTISSCNESGADLMLIDLSPLNIIFDFKANHVLTVSGNADYEYGDFKVGKHYYEFTLTDISDGSLITNLAQHVVEINTTSYCYCTGYESDKLCLYMACWGECNNLYSFVRK